MIFKLLSILLTLAICSPHQQRQLSNFDQLTIQGNTNEQIQVNFPLDQILSVHLNNQSNVDFVKLISKRFKLAVKRSITIDSSRKKSLLQQLRSPFTNQYTLMYYINEHLIIYEMPDTFLVIRESEYSFENVKKSKIAGMVLSSSIYQIEELFIIIAISAKQIVVMNQVLSAKQANPFNTTQPVIIKRIKNNSTRFIAILKNVVLFLQIKEKGIMSIVKSFNLLQKNLQIQVAAIERGQQYKNTEQFWILDQNKGLFVMVISNSLEVVSFPTLIQKQLGCFQMDADAQVHSFRVLLTCRSKGNNNFIEFNYDNDKIAYPFLIYRENPYDEKCSADRYMFFKNYVVSQQSESLDIFIPDHSVNGKVQYKKHWVTLDGINSFVIRRDQKRQNLIVYVAKNGILERRQLQFQKACLIINSQDSVDLNLPVKLEYICKTEQKGTLQICSMDMFLKINIHNNIVSYIQYKSINIGIILLLLTILAALVLLCRYKYRSIYMKKYQDLKDLTNPQKYQL